MADEQAPSMDVLAGQPQQAPDMNQGSPAMPSFGAPDPQGGGVGDGSQAGRGPKHHIDWGGLLQIVGAGLAGGAKSKGFFQGLGNGAAEELDQARKTEQVQMQKQELNSKIKFQDAQSANLVVETAIRDKHLHSMDQEQQDAHNTASLEQLKTLQGMGITPTIVTPNTKGGEEVKAGMQQLTASHGTVPPLFTINLGDKIVGFDLNQLTQAPQGLDQVNQMRAVTNPGTPPLDKQSWAQMPRAMQIDQMNAALKFTNPDPTSENLTVYNNYVDTLKAQPQSPERDQKIAQFSGIAARLDKSVKADQKRVSDSKVAAYNAETPGVVNRAGQVAKATEKAKADAASAGEWKPKVTADEKKKAELAENIASNANEVNNLLARRPDLVGKISGRITTVEQMIGNDDADISALGNHIHNIAMANSGVHGFRSQEGVKETENNLLNNFKNGPNAVAGALNANVGSVQTFIDNARPSGYQTHSSQGGAGGFYKTKNPGVMYAASPGKPRLMSMDGGKTWQPAQQQ